MPLRTIIVDFNVDDSVRDLENLLRCVVGVARLPTEDTLIDLSLCNYLGPTAVVALTLLRREAALAGVALSLVPPELPKLRAYCEYSGLLMEFGVGPPPQPHADNASTPVCIFTRLPQAEIEHVLRIAKREMPFSSSAREHLTQALSELAQNVLDHAASVPGGIMSSRAFKGKHEVRFAVADGGVGFYQTLSKQMFVANESEAIKRALVEGVTSRSSSHNFGLGLAHLHETVRRTKGELLIYSGKGVGDCGSAGDRFRLSKLAFPGTVAFVRLPAAGGEWDDDVSDVDVWG